MVRRPFITDFVTGEEITEYEENINTIIHGVDTGNLSSSGRREQAVIIDPGRESHELARVSSG